MRNWPLLIKKFVQDESDDVLSLSLKLHEVTERLTAAEFFSYEVNILEEAVVGYLDQRKIIREEYPEFFHRPKPKHHYLVHYAELIKGE